MSAHLNLLLILSLILPKLNSSEAQGGPRAPPPPPDTFGFRQLKTVLENKGISRPGPHLPPKFMIDLYQERTMEDLVNPDTTSTVRCILGKIKRESLNFNLTSLSEEENVNHAEIHIFRKKSGHGKLPRIKFYVAHHRKRRNFGGRKMTGEVSPLPPGRGWKTVQVTQIIKSSFRKWEVLGLGLEGLIPEFGTGKEVYHGLPLDEHIRIPYKPFLVIFSTTATTTVRSPLRIPDETNGIPAVTTGKRQQGLQRKETSGLQLQNSILGKDESGDEIGYGLNEIPESPRRFIKRRSPDEDEMDNRVPSNLDLILIPLPKVTGVNKGRRRFKAPSPVHQPQFKSPPTTKPPPSMPGCTLTEMWISLLDFDWADSILAPASVPLNSCSGSCSQVDYRRRNHLENVVDFCDENTWREERLNSNPCCAPSSFRRLSVLYVDSFGSILLQSFGNVTVGGCSCL